MRLQSGVVLIPFFLAVIFWILIGNYREELSLRRLRFSRIEEIDELDSKVLFLNESASRLDGFSEETPLPEGDEENEDEDYLESIKEEKKKPVLASF